MSSVLKAISKELVPNVSGVQKFENENTVLGIICLETSDSLSISEVDQPQQHVSYCRYVSNVSTVQAGRLRLDWVIILILYSQIPQLLFVTTARCSYERTERCFQGDRGQFLLLKLTTLYFVSNND